MEDWLKKAKETAKFEAESFVDNLRRSADEECVEFDWFLEETLKHVRKYSKE